MFLAAIFHFYTCYFARLLERIWPDTFYTIAGVWFLPGFALKCMTITHAPAEAEALRYVRQHTTIPVPKVYASVNGFGYNYFLMEKVKGDCLLDKWAELTDDQRDVIATQLQDYIAQLRRLHSPYGQKICAANGGQLWDARITCTTRVGPFDDESTFNDTIVKWAEVFLDRTILDEIRSRMRNDHRICFTHGDLAARNLIVKDGRISGVIDWGNSGWYPEHWELVKVMWYPELDKTWVDRARRLFSEEDVKDWLIDEEMSKYFVGCF